MGIDAATESKPETFVGYVKGALPVTIGAPARQDVSLFLDIDSDPVTQYGEEKRRLSVPVISDLPGEFELDAPPRAKSQPTTLLSRADSTRALAVFAMNLFMAYSSFAMVAPYLPDEAAGKGLSSSGAGVIIATYQLGYLVGVPIGGQRMKSTRPMRMLTETILISVLSNVAFGAASFLPGPWLFTAVCLVARALLGLSTAICNVMAFGMLPLLVSKEDVSKGAGLLETVIGAALGMGPMIGSLSCLGYVLPSLVLAALQLATALASRAVFPEIPAQDGGEGSSLRGFRWQVAVPLAGCALAGASMEWSSAILETFLERPPTHYGATLVGLILLVALSVYTLLGPFVGALDDYLGRYSLLLMGLGNLVSAVGFFMLAPKPWAVLLGLPVTAAMKWVSMVVASIGWAFALIPCFGAILRWAPPGSDEARGYSTAVVYNFSFALGGLCGPTLSGILADAFSLEASFSAISFTCLAMGLVLVAFHKLTQRC